MTEEQFRSGEGVQHGPFDYMAECDRTVTNTPFNTMYVDRDRFVALLADIASQAEAMNLFKKLLFRGKLPKDVGHAHPPLSHSLAVEFDPNNTHPSIVNVIHGLVGVITEAGEMAEVLLKMVETGELDPVNAMEECGDASWYIVRALRGMNTDIETMQRMNIDKLRGRHGEAFNAFRDSNRDLAEERRKLAMYAPPSDTFEKVLAKIDDAEDAGKLRDAIQEPNEAAVRKVLSDYDRRGEVLKDSLDGQPCEGTNPAQPPKGADHATPVWHDGCWRFRKKPLGDCEGMDC